MRALLTRLCEHKQIGERKTNPKLSAFARLQAARYGATSPELA